MGRIAKSLTATALIGAGALGGHMLGSNQASPNVAAASVTANTAAYTAATSADAAIEHAYDLASPSVVYVKNVGVGSGSGVIYDSSGDIVTNAHVVEGARSLSVTLSNGKTY